MPYCVLDATALETKGSELSCRTTLHNVVCFVQTGLETLHYTVV